MALRSLKPLTSRQGAVLLTCRQSSSSQSPDSKDIPLPKPASIKLREHIQRNPTVLNEYFDLSGYHDNTVNRLHDYLKIGELARQITSVYDRIKFVNPYERPWHRTEIKWHRLSHAPLHRPRKAWAIPLIPRYFDNERFYAFITKMRLPKDEKGALLNAAERKRLWSECYKTLNLPSGKLEKRVIESLICALDDKKEFTQDSSDKFLAQILDHGHAVLSQYYDFVDQRVSFNPRCESFWICAGFINLYQKQSVITGEIDTNHAFMIKYTGDHRRKLGELAFTMRDKLVAQIRQTAPLKNIDLEEAAFDNIFQHEPSADGLTLPPWIYNLERDGEILWQCPGFDADSGEQHLYGRLAIKNTHALHDQIQLWGMTDANEISQTRQEALRATAIATLFNWLNGQAHCAGYTQYTDDGNIDFKSQLILSDGREFFFAIGQLRYLAFNVDWDKIEKNNPDYVRFIPKRQPNRMIYEGPYYLFDEYDPATRTFKYRDENTNELKPGLNPIVLQYLLHMLIVK